MATDAIPKPAFPVPPADAAKHHVQTHLTYHLYDGLPTADVYPERDPLTDRPVGSAIFPHTITDVTGNEQDYTLDNAGFQFVHHESKEKDFKDEDKIKREYYPEVMELLKQVTGGSRVFVFDHTVRNKKESLTVGGPVQKVHVDHSYADVPRLVKFHLPDEAEELLKRRVQVVNVWRPIKPIYKDPLAVADKRTVPEEDLLTQKTVFPRYQLEAFALKPNPAHKFYYRYGQTPDIVTLIKTYESKTDGVARNCPHSSFVNPETVNYPVRESIETRCIIFH
ncbi:hypothetical protein B0J11DRAFT_588232 [Dendryphion nanum]|uniref:Methyltransferase n=1 Tax=Dendryphion nanum TaxID=256645 RepID=A0A9P9IWZ5_9PLEO|nr:hypothetical protein B0J11DRAFT_588232 [Dendryphion nanum]